MPLGALSFSINLESGQFLEGDAQRAGLILLVAMLLSFLFIRFSTRMIRAEVSWWPGNVTPGGLHIHHLVFGIVLMMLAGFLQFALQPDSPWLEILAAAFGVGVGLTLDEFALWLYLEDVYWAEEGRRSVDAVIMAAIIGGALVLGFVPVSTDDQGSIAAIVLTIAIVLGICLVAATKGKFWSAVGGMFIPLVGIIAAVRVSRPGSPWARRFYKPGSRRAAKSEAREQRHNRRWRRFQDLVGGAPSLPSPRKGRGHDG
jgi:lysyl-tRNA synthetase class 2